MRLHPHIWKYFSSKHRICRICGEPQWFKGDKYSLSDIDQWYFISLKEFLIDFPLQLKIDEEEKLNEKISNRTLKKWEEENKKEALQFLKEYTEFNECPN